MSLDNKHNQWAEADQNWTGGPAYGITGSAHTPLDTMNSSNQPSPSPFGIPIPGGTTLTNRTLPGKEVAPLSDFNKKPTQMTNTTIQQKPGMKTMTTGGTFNPTGETIYGDGIDMGGGNLSDGLGNDFKGGYDPTGGKTGGGDTFDPTTIDYNDPAQVEKLRGWVNSQMKLGSGYGTEIPDGTDPTGGGPIEGSGMDGSVTVDPTTGKISLYDQQELDMRDLLLLQQGKLGQNAVGAQAAVEKGYDNAIGLYSNEGPYGEDFKKNAYTDISQQRNALRSGQYDINPFSYMTGTQFSEAGTGPKFQEFQSGAGPLGNVFQQSETQQASAFQRQAGPNAQQFQRQAGPQFQQANQGQFNYNHQASPGYQFQMEQGLNAINAGRGAQGLRKSGAATKDTMRFAQGLANQDYAQGYNRARGAFESDRAMGERQAGAQNQFAQNQFQAGQNLDFASQQAFQGQQQSNYRFGIGSDMGEQARVQQMRQQAGQFETGVNVGELGRVQSLNQQGRQFSRSQDFAANQQANQFNQNQYQFDEKYGLERDRTQNQANLAANQQNYNMHANQVSQQFARNQSLSDRGYSNIATLSNLYTGQGESSANAILGVAAERRMASAQANAQDSGGSIWGTLLGIGGGIAGAIYGGPAGAMAGYTIGSGAGSYLD